MDTEKKDVKRISTTPFIRIPEKAKVYPNGNNGKTRVRKVKKGQVFA